MSDLNESPHSTLRHICHGHNLGGLFRASGAGTQFARGGCSLEVTTFAAVVQAGAAVIIVMLTVILARIAGDSSKAAAASSAAAAKSADVAAISAQAAVDQAKATAASYQEMRRQSQLAAVPLIAVGRPKPTLSDESILVDTLITLDNVSQNVALDVRTAILFLDNQHQPQREHARAIPLPMLAAGKQSERALPSNDIRNVGRVVDPKILEERGTTYGNVEEHSYAEFGPYYGYDWLMVRVECRSILGGIVIHEYDWNANWKDQHASGVWSLRRVSIQPDPDHPNDVIELRTS